MNVRSSGMSFVRSAVPAIVLLSTLSMAAARAPLQELQPARAGQRILVIAPHIDDEGLAAAGYVNDAVAAGAEVFIIYLTAGDHSRTALAANRLTFFAMASLNRKGERRMLEGRVATRAIGLDESNLILLGYPDRGLRRMLLRPGRDIRSASTGKKTVPYSEALSPGAPYRLESIVADLSILIERIQPEIVIAPHVRDHHPDHRTAAVLMARLLAETDLAPVRLGYVIHRRGTSIARMAAAADADYVTYPLTPETQKRKRQMLLGYKSQRRSPYMRFLFDRSQSSQELFVRYRT